MIDIISISCSIAAVIINLAVLLVCYLEDRK